MRFKTFQVKGHGRGKLLGFPTINMQIPEGFSIDEGIWAANVFISKTKYLGAMHYGPIPVFKENEKSLEVFLIGIKDENFKLEKNQEIELEPKKYIRKIMAFKSQNELSLQIKKDVEEIRKIVG